MGMSFTSHDRSSGLNALSHTSWVTSEYAADRRSPSDPLTGQVSDASTFRTVDDDVRRRT